MPVCPKCKRLISAKKYARHVKRCGTTHKHSPRPLMEHGPADRSPLLGAALNTTVLMSRTLLPFRLPSEVKQIEVDNSPRFWFGDTIGRWHHPRHLRCIHQPSVHWLWIRGYHLRLLLPAHLATLLSCTCLPSRFCHWVPFLVDSVRKAAFPIFMIGRSHK